MLSSIGNREFCGQFKSRRDKECEDTDPPLIFLNTFFEDDVVYTRDLDVCLVSLAAGSPCPGYCTDTHVVINEINVRGGTGVGPPPVHHMVRGIPRDKDR